MDHQSKVDKTHPSNHRNAWHENESQASEGRIACNWSHLINNSCTLNTVQWSFGYQRGNCWVNWYGTLNTKVSRPINNSRMGGHFGVLVWILARRVIWAEAFFFVATKILRILKQVCITNYNRCLACNYYIT